MICDLDVFSHGSAVREICEQLVILTTWCRFVRCDKCNLLDRSILCPLLALVVRSKGLVQAGYYVLFDVVVVYLDA